jgi:hypothetical protein
MVIALGAGVGCSANREVDICILTLNAVFPLDRCVLIAYNVCEKGSKK